MGVTLALSNSTDMAPAWLTLIAFGALLVLAELLAIVKYLIETLENDPYKTSDLGGCDGRIFHGLL